MADYCRHEMPPSQCADCLDPPNPRRVRTSGVGPAWTARYSGQCPSCLGRIEEGDEVRRYDGHVLHARCAEILA